MALLLGIDFGTSYFKVGLFDARGVQKGLGRVAVHKASPYPGW
ncbi:MAG: family of carbohydrate kinase, N-terminal domain, partial [Verrucomicrobiota bacterium]